MVAPFDFINFIFLAIFFMILISSGFIGLGLIFASVLKDIQGFGLIIQMTIFPFALFELSDGQVCDLCEIDAEKLLKQNMKEKRFWKRNFRQKCF